MENQNEFAQYEGDVVSLAFVAVLSSPAFAQKRQHVTHVNQSDVSNVVPGYDVSKVVPGYTKDGATVAVPNPDQR